MKGIIIYSFLEQVYFIKYPLRIRQGTMPFFYVDFSRLVFFKNTCKQALDETGGFNTCRLIRDKYKFIKNGKKEFNCRLFF